MSRHPILIPSRPDVFRLLTLAGASTIGGGCPSGDVHLRQDCSSKEIPEAQAASPGLTRMRCLRIGTCPRRWGGGRVRRYDNDGRVHIFMVNSGQADFDQPKMPLKNALDKKNCDDMFSDVTDKAGVAGGREFGTGRAIANYDNDGPDILVTCTGDDVHTEQRNGTSTDITAKSGSERPVGRQRGVVRLRQRVGST